MKKQTQSNPTCSELACPELVEGVEPISKGMRSFADAEDFCCRRAITARL